MTASASPCTDQSANGEGHFATRMRHKCPACGGPAKIRHSRPYGDVTTALYFQCQHVPCGMTYMGMISIEYYISPSAMPEPLVDLPPPPHGAKLPELPTNNGDPLNDPDAPPLPFLAS